MNEYQSSIRALSIIDKCLVQHLRGVMNVKNGFSVSLCVFLLLYKVSAGLQWLKESMSRMSNMSVYIGCLPLQSCILYTESSCGSSFLTMSLHHTFPLSVGAVGKPHCDTVCQNGFSTTREKICRQPLRKFSLCKFRRNQLLGFFLTCSEVLTVHVSCVMGEFEKL